MLGGKIVMGKTYWKPPMHALPPDIGRRIIRHILETPAPDWDDLAERARQMEKQFLAEEENEKETTSV